MNTAEADLLDIDLAEMGSRIRERREFYGYSREKLSEILDVTPQFLALVEYGNKGLSIKNLYKLSVILKTSVDYLLAGIRKDEKYDDELASVRERIMAVLCRCSAKELEYLEQIIVLYEASMRMKTE